MKELVIFADLTTEEALTGIEAEAAKYDGLYVNMADGKQRKFVKDKAVLIKDLLKKIERARIDKPKHYKTEVDSEAAEIKLRLESANEPFTLLIDNYAEERAKVLAEEKRVNEEKLAAIQYARDYDDAAQLDRLFDLEAKDKAAQKVLEQQAIEERERLIAENAATQAREDAAQLIVKQQQESEAREKAAKQAVIDSEIKAKQAVINAEANAKLAAEAAEMALQHQAARAEIDKKAAIEKEVKRQADEQKAKADALAKREANTANRRKVNNAAMQCFIKGGLSKEDAKLAVTLIAEKSITSVQINY